ncbi:MAG: SUMF1/EgtB/PvdO family nonheme iron enzyme, partial [Verrucomicrobiota bacterium]
MKPHGSGSVWRGDLVRAFKAGGIDAVRQTADLLAWHEVVPEPTETGPEKREVDVLPAIPTAGPEHRPVWAPVVCCRPVRYEYMSSHESSAAEKAEPVTGDLEAEPQNVEPGRWEPLTSWPSLVPRFRRAASVTREGGDLDTDGLVRAIGRGDIVEHFPRQPIRKWGPQAIVIVDRSWRLVPYWKDQDFVLRRLADVFPRNGITVRLTRGRAPRLSDILPARPAPSALCLVLGDLGSLEVDELGLSEGWTRFGSEARALGLRALALCPSRTRAEQSAAARGWEIMGWERHAHPRMSPQEGRALAHRLVTLLSPAVRVEPGLMRAVRRAVGGPMKDAGIEALAWQHTAIASAHPVAATFDQDLRVELQQAFNEEPEEIRRLVLDLIRRWRQGLDPSVWFHEVFSLATSNRGLVPAGDVDAAYRFYAGLMASNMNREDAQPATAAYLMRELTRLNEHCWKDPRIGSGLRQLLATYIGPKTGSPPPGFRPDEAVHAPDWPGTWEIRATGPLLTAHEGNSDRGSLLATLDNRKTVLQIREADEPGIQPPDWAVAAGDDDDGIWADFEVEGVRQRMRWISPGTFMMGSPEDEPGRYDDETRHEVRLTRGLWLFDTACTQALWKAVMKAEPSRFKGLRRPVENVSWNDCQTFLSAINRRVPGLDLELPTEAQWEYACRAGTESPFSFGSQINPDLVNYDGNYPYAGGEKGLYRRETVDVGSLPGNRWGLYEMHGNVWEWCADYHGSYPEGPQVDPAGPESGSDRVFRGGSWAHDARSVRAAYRNWYEPDNRSIYLGFRCARVQKQEEAEPERVRLRPQAERRRTVARSGGARLIHLAGAVDRSCPAPQAPEPFVIESDVEAYTFDWIEQPAWATDFGRDRFGLWADFAVERPEAKPVIQRMRWIPPGRFKMGSPEDEPERSESEGPQHEVTLSEGFWLFDTACPQALWTAVMGKNPSRFQGEQRPVEQVNWNDSVEFMDALNDRTPGLQLTLPSEAQ